MANCDIELNQYEPMEQEGKDADGTNVIEDIYHVPAEMLPAVKSQQQTCQLPAVDKDSQVISTNDFTTKRLTVFFITVIALNLLTLAYLIAIAVFSCKHNSLSEEITNFLSEVSEATGNGSTEPRMINIVAEPSIQTSDQISYDKILQILNTTQEEERFSEKRCCHYKLHTTWRCF